MCRVPAWSAGADVASGVMRGRPGNKLAIKGLGIWFLEMERGVTVLCIHSKGVVSSAFVWLLFFERFQIGLSFLVSVSNMFVCFSPLLLLSWHLSVALLSGFEEVF